MGHALSSKGSQRLGRDVGYLLVEGRREEGRKAGLQGGGLPCVGPLLCCPTHTCRHLASPCGSASEAPTEHRPEWEPEGAGRMWVRPGNSLRLRDQVGERGAELDTHWPGPGLGVFNSATVTSAVLVNLDACFPSPSPSESLGGTGGDPGSSGLEGVDMEHSRPAGRTAATTTVGRCSLRGPGMGWADVPVFARPSRRQHAQKVPPEARAEVRGTF